jgi:hypothetical protein
VVPATGHCAESTHPHHQRLVVGKALPRHGLRVQSLDIQPSGHLIAAVEAGGDIGLQLPVLWLAVKVAATALDQLLLQPVFPVPVRALDRTVLVGYAAVVAAGDHTQMGAELAVTTRVVTGIGAITVAVTGAEAVGAVLSRHPAAKRQGVLQGFSQSNKALAAVDHFHMAPTGVRQAEMKQPVLKHLPTDRDGLTLEQGEIVDPKHAGAVPAGTSPRGSDRAEPSTAQRGAAACACAGTTPGQGSCAPDEAAASEVRVVVPSRAWAAPRSLTCRPVDQRACATGAGPGAVGLSSAVHRDQCAEHCAPRCQLHQQRSDGSGHGAVWPCTAT